jgi:hypothetical protein
MLAAASPEVRAKLYGPLSIRPEAPPPPAPTDVLATVKLLIDRDCNVEGLDEVGELPASVRFIYYY